MKILKQQLPERNNEVKQELDWNSLVDGLELTMPKISAVDVFSSD